MRTFICILIISMSAVACKNDAKQNVDLEQNRAKSYDQNDGYITMRGEFVYDANHNAAVFQTRTEIYGVVVDDSMHKLNAQVQEFKTDEYTSVPVTVRVKKIKNNNPDILWESTLEIKDILKVEAPDPNNDDVIKLSN